MSAKPDPESFAHVMTTEERFSSSENVQPFLQGLNQILYNNTKGVNYETYVTFLAKQSLPKFTNYLFKLLELNRLTKEQALQLADMSIEKFKKVKDTAEKEKAAALVQKATAVIQAKSKIIVKSEPRGEVPAGGAADAGQTQPVEPAMGVQIQDMGPAAGVPDADQTQPVEPAVGAQIQVMPPAASQIQAMEPAERPVPDAAGTGKRLRVDSEDEPTDEDEDSLIMINSKKRVTVKEFKKMHKQSLQFAENTLLQDIKTKKHETEFTMASYQEALKNAERALTAHNQALQAYAEATEVHSKFVYAINTYRGNRY
jgi:hypothetical protein